MAFCKELLKVYAVTDRAWAPTQEVFLAQIEAALQGGISCLQLREKHISNDEFLKEALTVKKLCASYRVPLIINDNVQVSQMCDADGVHVGQDDMSLPEARRILGPDKIIGVSAHTIDEALWAEKNGADYLGLGAVFATSTKPDVDVMPMGAVQRITGSVHIPCVAIGGIHENNLLQLKGSGVAGVAVVSAIFASADPALAVKRLNELTEEMLL